MGASPWFWFWVWLSVLLVVAEILTLGLFMLPFGIGAAAAAAYFGLSSGLQWVIFGGVSVVCLFALQRYASLHNRAPLPGIAGDRMMGERGVVTETIDRVAGSGRVRVHREDWRADSASGADIPAGTKVVVERVDGTHLIVSIEDTE